MPGLAARSCDGRQRGLGVRDHNVDEKAGLGGWPARYEGSADLADSVIEGSGTVKAGPHLPAERLRVELGGAGRVHGRDFDVADFARAPWRPVFYHRWGALRVLVSATSADPVGSDPASWRRPGLGEKGHQRPGSPIRAWMPRF
jgi:hypothetical protein